MEPTLPDVPEWPEHQLLALEKEALGFYVTGHPLGEFAGDLAKLTTPSSDFEKVKEGAEVRVGGLVKAVKNYTDRKGETMAFVTLEDLDGTMEVTIFSKLFKIVAPLVVADAALVVVGKANVTEGGVKILADEVFPIAEAKERLTRAVHLRLQTPGLERETLEQVGQTGEAAPGRRPGVRPPGDPAAQRGRAEGGRRLPGPAGAGVRARPGAAARKGRGDAEMNKMHGALDFEKPLIEAEGKLEALFADAGGRFVSLEEVAKLRRKIRRLRHDIFAKLTPWQRAQIARHPARPYFLDFAKLMFEDAIEIHGDRTFADDQSIVTLLARFEGRSVVAIGHQKGRNVKENILRNFGMPNPEGYRKALRAMKLAEKFGKPVLTFIDTPGAYPGIGAEERGQSEAIARNIQEMSQLRVPVICTVIGEGGSGGALAIGVGNRVQMLAERDLLGDLARGLRGHPLAQRPLARAGGGRDAQDERGGRAGVRADRRDRARAARRRAPQPPLGGEPAAARAAAQPGRALGSRRPTNSSGSARRSSGTWAASRRPRSNNLPPLGTPADRPFRRSARTAPAGRRRSRCRR